MMPGVVASFPVKAGPLIQPTMHTLTVGQSSSGNLWGFGPRSIPAIGDFSPVATAVPGYTMNVSGLSWDEFAADSQMLQLEIEEVPFTTAVSFNKLSSIRSIEIAGVEFLMADAVKSVVSYRYTFGWPSTNILGPVVGGTKSVKINYF